MTRQVLANTAMLRTSASVKCLPLLMTALWLLPAHAGAAETIDIAIGHGEHVHRH